jgi:hypothetical protein
VNDDKLLSTVEAADRLGVSASYLNKLRMTAGAGPVFLRLGVTVRYRNADINAWLEAQARASTTDAQPVAGEAAS